MVKTKKLVVSDMLGQEIKRGQRVIYLKGSFSGYVSLQSIVKQVKIRERTEKDAEIYCSPLIFQITLDCGKIWGIRKVRDPEKLIVVSKLRLTKWRLGA